MTRPEELYPQRRCTECLVGGKEENCWYCGQPMEYGSVTLLKVCYGRDTLVDYHTHLDPADHLPLKALDGLTPRVGDSPYATKGIQRPSWIHSIVGSQQTDRTPTTTKKKTKVSATVGTQP